MGKLLTQWRRLPRAVRKPLIAVLGGTVLLLGVLMIVLPGPAILVIPAGLVILAVEFVWARQLLKRVQRKPPNP